MDQMPNMLAYTIKGSLSSGSPPYMIVGQGPSRVQIAPSLPADDTYWFVFIDRNNPMNKVQDFVVPGQNNSSVPAGVDQYMTNPEYIFAVATQFLAMNHVPQGPLFDYLTQYGAGRELMRIEQLNSAFGCGSLGRPSYILTSQCGPRGDNLPAPAAYEVASITDTPYLTMSLMPMPDGSPPYGISDQLTRVTTA
jgi:hypothetical protein